MNKGIQTIIYPVKDITAAKALYTALLGIQPAYDEAYYVGFKVNGQDVGLDPHGHREGASAYYEVDDLKQTLQSLLNAGAQIVQDVKDVGGGKLIASVKDADGNIIGLTQTP